MLSPWKFCIPSKSSTLNRRGWGNKGNNHFFVARLGNQSNFSRQNSWLKLALSSINRVQMAHHKPFTSSATVINSS